LQVHAPAYRRLVHGTVLILVMLWMSLVMILGSLGRDDVSTGLVFFAGLLGIILVYMGLDGLAEARVVRECSQPGPRL